MIPAFLLGMSAVLFSNSAGAPAGKAGDKGSTCIACHNSHSLGDNNTAVGIAVKDDNGNVVTSLTDGMQYTIEVSVSSGSSFATGGFELTAVATGAGSSDPSVGTFSGGSMVQKISQGNRDYVTHIATKPSVQGNAISWQFQWTAPATLPSSVTFYAAGIAANGNGTSSGDYVGAGTVVLPRSSATGIASTAASNGLNPVWRHGRISVTFPEGNIVSAAVYNAAGQTLKRFSNLSGHVELPFPSSGKGLHWLVAQTRNGQWLRGAFFTK